MLYIADRLVVGEQIGVQPAVYRGSNGLWKKYTVIKVTKTQITLSDGNRYLKNNGRILGGDQYHAASLMSIEDTDKHNEQVKHIVERQMAMARIDKVVDAFKYGHIEVAQLMPHLEALEAYVRDAIRVALK